MVYNVKKHMNFKAKHMVQPVVFKAKPYMIFKVNNGPKSCHQPPVQLAPEFLHRVNAAAA